MSRLDGSVHLNLIESSRQLFEMDSGVSIDAGEGWLFGAGRSAHPAISNAAFRADDALDPEEFLARAFAFFGKREHGFSVWVRGDRPEDRDLVAAAEAAGLQHMFEMPEMVLEARAAEAPLPEGTDLRRLRSSSECDDYWQVATASYSGVGFPPEVFRYYENYAPMLADNVAAFIAYLDERPVAIAMTVVSHGVAGIYWVGSVEEARNKGLGRAVTAAATNAGFDLGASVASLQASPMGVSVYTSMGFETIYAYRPLMSAP